MKKTKKNKQPIDWTKIEKLEIEEVVPDCTVDSIFHEFFDTREALVVGFKLSDDFANIYMSEIMAVAKYLEVVLEEVVICLPIDTSKKLLEVSFVRGAFRG
jgi:hypothetical protein